MALSKASTLTFAIVFAIAWCVCIIIGATLVALARSDVIDLELYNNPDTFFSNDLPAFVVGGIFLFLGFVFFVTDVIYWVMWLKNDPPTVKDYPQAVPLQQYQPVPMQSGAPPPPFCTYCGQQKFAQGPCGSCKN